MKKQLFGDGKTGKLRGSSLGHQARIKENNNTRNVSSERENTSSVRANLLNEKAAV